MSHSSAPGRDAPPPSHSRTAAVFQVERSKSTDAVVLFHCIHSSPLLLPPGSSNLSIRPWIGDCSELQSEKLQHIVFRQQKQLADVTTSAYLVILCVGSFFNAVVLNWWESQDPHFLFPYNEVATQI